MKLSILKAQKGDAFLLEWGDSNKYSIIIDGGYPGTYNKQLKDKIEKLSNLKAIFVTHIDYDHIGGIIELLNDEDVSHNYECYINTPELIVDKIKSSKVAYHHGDLLTKLLSTKNIQAKSIFLPENKKLEIEGLILTILSPTFEILEKLKVDWNAYLLKEHLEKENKTSDKTSASINRIKPNDEILLEKESVYKWKDDTINASSIAFIAEYLGKKILFLGDSNPTLIEEQLRELGYRETTPLIVDIVKISHHGSKHNTTKNLLKLVKTESVVISTNQGGNSYHPNRDTVIKIAHCIQRKSDRLEFILNYDLDKSKFITQEEIIKYKLDFRVRSFKDLV